MITAVLLITLIAIVLFTTEVITSDTTALLVMVLLLVSGILSPEQALSGFSNEATISVFALLVLSLGLQSTGFVNELGDILEHYAGRAKWLTYFITTVVSGFASAFMNNTAVVAILLPVVNRLAKSANINVSKLLMPLSFAAMIGGTCTIIGTSTNIIVNAIYEQHYGSSLGIFEIAPIGIALFVGFLLFMLIAGRFIPERKHNNTLTSDYDVQKYLAQLVVNKGSPLIGKSLLELENMDIVQRHRLRILNIYRNDAQQWIPQSDVTLQENDVLVIKARLDSLLDIEGQHGISLKKEGILDDRQLTSEEAVLFEAVVDGNSSIIGKQIKTIDFRQIFGAIPLAMRRSGASVATMVMEHTVQFGDVLLMEARRSNLDKFLYSPDFIVLERVKKRNVRSNKMFLSLAIVVGVISLAALGLMPIVSAALLGCCLMLLSGCVSTRYIYKNMDWKVIFLLAGILPLGIAVETTGASQLITHYLLLFMQQLDPSIIVALLYLVTVLITSIMSNNATAILLAPIAIELSTQLNLPPKAFLITVMIAASTSFLTPIGYQTNTLIYGAGQYKFMDFVKIGGALTVVVWLLSSYLISAWYF